MASAATTLPVMTVIWNRQKTQAGEKIKGRLLDCQSVRIAVMNSKEAASAKT